MTPSATSVRLTALVAFLFVATLSAQAVEIGISFIRPSETDPAIKTFDQPHRIYSRTGSASPGNPPMRQELLLWITGTMPPPSAGAPKADPTGDAPGREGAEAFCQLAAKLGYHVISLRYPNDTSASAARNETDEKEFERFRRAIIEGGNSKFISLPRSESIEHRLIKLLQHLVKTRPTEGWDRYLTSDSSIRWERLALAGQSQGSGHVALIALQHLVLRVICTGAPKDFNVAHHAPAAWLRGESATPRDRFFAFNHLQDRQAASWAQQLENLRALKLDAFGPPVNVDKEKPPYRHTRILFTDYPGGTLTSQQAHTSVINFRNAAVFEPVWRYMLTESAQ